MESATDIAITLINDDLAAGPAGNNGRCQSRKASTDNDQRTGVRRGHLLDDLINLNSGMR